MLTYVSSFGLNYSYIKAELNGVLVEFFISALSRHANKVLENLNQSDSFVFGIGSKLKLSVLWDDLANYLEWKAQNITTRDIPGKQTLKQQNK